MVLIKLLLILHFLLFVGNAFQMTRSRHQQYVWKGEISVLFLDFVRKMLDWMPEKTAHCGAVA